MEIACHRRTQSQIRLLLSLSIFASLTDVKAFFYPPGCSLLGAAGSREISSPQWSPGSSRSLSCHFFRHVNQRRTVSLGASSKRWGVISTRASNSEVSVDEQREGGGMWRCRGMIREDIAYLVMLDKECYGGSGLWTAEMYAEELVGELSEVVVLEPEGSSDKADIVGVGALSHVLDEGSITNVAVSPSAQRKGFGSMVVHGLLKRAKALNLCQLYLEVRAESNPAAIALYRRFGFTQVGRRKKYYAAVDGSSEKEDALILSRGEITDSDMSEWEQTGWGKACLVD